MKGPFIEWLRWYSAHLVPRVASEIEDHQHPRLGEGVFRFVGEHGLAIYERGIGSLGEKAAIAFDDITGFDVLSLQEVAWAQSHPSGPVELPLRTRSGDVVLKLPLTQYSALLDILGEHTRRSRLQENAEV